MHNLQVHISHFQDFNFNLNANEPASLYSDGNFAHIIGTLYVTVSRVINSVSFFCQEFLKMSEIMLI